MFKERNSQHQIAISSQNRNWFFTFLKTFINYKINCFITSKSNFFVSKQMQVWGTVVKYQYTMPCATKVCTWAGTLCYSHSQIPEWHHKTITQVTKVWRMRAVLTLPNLFLFCSQNLTIEPASNIWWTLPSIGSANGPGG